MLSGAHKGEWFLPGRQKFPGQLIIDSQNQTIYLEIYGSMYLEGIQANSHAHPEHFHTIILGNHPTCTLYNCHWAGSSEVGTNLYRITYRIEYIFSEFHFLDAEIPVCGGTFVYPHLATWYDGDEFHDKLEGRGGLYIDGKEVIENTLREEELSINHDLTLVFRDEVNKQIEELDISYCVRYSKHVRFQYSTNVSFKQLLKDAITFLKLLSFSFSKPLNLFIIYVYADSASVSSSEDSIWFSRSGKHLIHVNNYTLKREKNIPNHAVHDRDMVMSQHTLSKEELNEVIIRWFANEKLYGIYEYYLDSNNWFQDTKAKLSNVMFNNRFLNLIQGLEAYFKEFYPRKISISPTDQQLFSTNKQKILNLIQDSTLRNWLAQSLKSKKATELTLQEKLRNLIVDLAPDLDNLFQSITLTEFPESASKFRNQLSHGGNREINLGVRLHEDFYIAQVLLGTCILRSLGVKQLNERTAYYAKFQDAAYQIYYFQKQRGVQK